MLAKMSEKEKEAYRSDVDAKALNIPEELARIADRDRLKLSADRCCLKTFIWSVAGIFSLLILPFFVSHWAQQSLLAGHVDAFAKSLANDHAHSSLI